MQTPTIATLHLLDRVNPFAHPATEDFALGADGVHSVHVGHRPMEFQVLEGEVLVTCEGDLEDHVLRAGATFRTERRGHHVIAGLRPSRVHVAEAQERRAA